MVENTVLQAPTHYVGVGASAGGLEAIENLFKHMPANSGLAFIVVQHLSPDYKSLMVELLSKHTQMPVHRITEGMVVEANSVYLIPPKTNLTIFHGKLLLLEQDYSRGINLPIDIFLRSLAEDQAEKSVAIILSGTGSDGVRGIRAIKESGGMVMVQDEESAKFDGMPRSAIATGLPDFVLPPDEMPQQLLSFIKHPYASKTEVETKLLTNEDGLTRIFAMLRERTKVDFTYYKPSTVVRRIERRMSVNQIHELRDYVHFMESYPKEVNTLYRELLIGVTNFFRDAEAFKELDEQWLPQLLEQTKSNEIRFWVAACSTGEEAYSLAILAKECMERLERSCNVKIFATDVDRDAIMLAGNGIYPESIAADVSSRLLSKYFHRRDDSFQISRNIREMVVFAQHNLIKDPPFTNIDFISCRNVLIYLQPVLQKKVLEQFNFSLNRTGLLFLGSSESVGDMSSYFELLNNKWRIYQSKDKHRPSSINRQDIAISNYAIPNMSLHHTGNRVSWQQNSEERMLNRLLQDVVEEYMPLTVIVNEELEPLHVLGDAAGFFTLPRGKAVHDITKMATRELSIPLSTALQKVFKSREEVNYNNVRIKDKKGEDRLIKIRIRLLPERKGQEPLAVVLLEEIDITQNHSVTTSTSYDLGHEAEQRINDLEQELQFTRENLQATIEELETSNEELQATNEELLASNEELQSTNEELQSVNEELHTVNAEHQSKILELTELTNDLDNLLSSSRVGTVFLDEELIIRRFTPAVTRLFNFLETDVGRPLAHISHRFHIEIMPVLKEVQIHNITKQQEVRAEDGSYYLMSVQPYQVGPEVYAGIVLNFVDISELKAIETELKLSEERYVLAQKAAKMGTWDWDLNTNKVVWSELLEPMFGLKPGEFLGTFNAFMQCVHAEDRDLVKHSVQQCIEQDVPYDIEMRVVWKTGAVHWLHALGHVYRDESGKALRMMGISHDITEQKSMEKDLRKSKDKLSRYFQQPFIGMAISTPDHRIIEVNDKLCEMLGYAREELLEMKWIDFTHPDDLAESKTLHERIFNDGLEAYTLQKRYLCRDGSTLFANLAVLCVRDEYQQPEYIHGFVQDVTELHHYHAQLEQKTKQLEKNNAMLNSILRAAPVGVGVVKKRVFEWVSPCFCEMLGYKEEELIGQSTRIIYADEAEFERVGKEKYAQLEQQSVGKVETQFQRKNGSLVRVLLSSSKMLGDFEGTTFTAMILD